VVTVKTQPANGTTQTVHLSVVRGKTPIEDKTKKHNVLNKVFDGVSNNKVVKSAINRLRERWTRLFVLKEMAKRRLKILF
jgi:nicotinamidase-related amidase